MITFTKQQWEALLQALLLVPVPKELDAKTAHYHLVGLVAQKALAK